MIYFLSAAPNAALTEDDEMPAPNPSHQPPDSYIQSAEYLPIEVRFVKEGVDDRVDWQDENGKEGLYHGVALISSMKCSKATKPSGIQQKKSVIMMAEIFHSIALLVCCTPLA